MEDDFAASWMEDHFALPPPDIERDPITADPELDAEVQRGLDELSQSFRDHMRMKAPAVLLPQPAKRYRLLLTLLDITDGDAPLAPEVELTVEGTGEVVYGAGTAALSPYDT